MTTKDGKHATAEKHSITGDVTGMVEAGTQRINEITESAMERIEEVGDRAVEARKGIERRVREQPLMALLLAAGLGFVFGALWRGR